MATFKDFEILSPKNFQLHATASAIFTATSSAEIVSIEFNNASPTSYWAKLFYATASLGADSASFQRLSETMASGSTLEYKRTPLPLKAGESIFGQAQNSASINVSIIGRVV